MLAARAGSAGCSMWLWIVDAPAAWPPGRLACGGWRGQPSCSVSGTACLQRGAAAALRTRPLDPFHPPVHLGTCPAGCWPPLLPGKGESEAYPKPPAAAMPPPASCMAPCARSPHSAAYQRHQALVRRQEELAPPLALRLRAHGVAGRAVAGAGQRSACRWGLGGAAGAGALTAAQLAREPACTHVHTRMLVQASRVRVA